MAVGDFRIECEWLEPGRARGAELRATWARLVVAVGGDAVTRVADSRTASVRDAVYVPVYPLAETIAANWWALLYEVENPRAIRHAGFAARHDLGRNNDGYALPHLSVAAEAPAMRLRWGGGSLATGSVEFLGRGDCLLPYETVVHTLRRFVDNVCERLLQAGILGTWLQTEWEAISGTDEDELEYCRVAAALGLDPFNTDEDLVLAAGDAVASLPRGLQEDFLGATNAPDVPAEARRLSQMLDETTASAVPVPYLAEARKSVAMAGISAPPWATGYELARNLRRVLGLTDEGPANWSHLGLESAGSTDEATSLPPPVGPRPTPYDALMAVPDPGRLGILTTRTRGTARRFAEARCIGEFMARPEDTGPAIMTAAHSARQQRSRAFAAELLAPAASIKSMLGGLAPDDDAVTAIAEDLGVSDAVVRHQIENQLA